MADIREFPDVPGYVSIKQAAEMLGITDKRVYRYIDLGRLTAFKSGGVFLLPEEEVKRFKLNPPVELVVRHHPGAPIIRAARCLPLKLRYRSERASKNAW